MGKNAKSCVILCSGNGSNLGSIFDSITAKETDAVILAIVSNNSESRALKVARDMGIEAIALPKGANRDTKLIEVIRDLSPDFILLAGYLKKIPTELITLYRNRILNIHPSLLPKYGGKGMYGLHVHKAVLESGDKTSGATVHLVNEIYDDGKIILQDSLDIASDDTPESLAKRVFEIEKKLYPRAIQLFLKTLLND